MMMMALFATKTKVDWNSSPSDNGRKIWIERSNIMNVEVDSLFHNNNGKLKLLSTNKW
jgi:hypothetical protein